MKRTVLIDTVKLFNGVINFYPLLLPDTFIMIEALNCRGHPKTLSAEKQVATE